VKKNHLTIIFMKDTNRPVTFELSIKLLILLVVLLVGGASTYTFFIRGYYSLYRDNQELETIVRSQKTEIGKLQNTILKFKARKAAADTIEQQTALLAELQEDSLSTSDVVNIQGLKIETDREEGDFNYSFILEKISEKEDIVKGYMFVVLKNYQQDKKISSIPEVKFKNGEPVDFRGGDRFTIRRFKQYKDKFRLEKEADILEILVYSDMGELLLRLRRPTANI